MKFSTYDKIEAVFAKAGRAMTATEFRDVHMEEAGLVSNGLYFTGCSEATLGRRMREMAQAGRLTRRIRAGENYKEFALAVREPVAA